MQRREFVTFTADFPDDAQWDAQGNLLVPGGRSIAEALCQELSSQGVSCSPPSVHSFYGWAFVANIDGLTFWCLLQVGDAWLLILKPKTSLTSLFSPERHAERFDDLQAKLHQTLTTDNRFDDILWYTRQDYQSSDKRQGHPMPR